MVKGKNDVDELLKKVLLMETQQAFDFLKDVNVDDAVVNKVAQLLQPSATRTAFLNERGLLAEAVSVKPDIDLSGETIQNIKIIEPLGEGGMGTVYLAEDINLQRKVAIKALHNSHQVSPNVQARFRREALILSKLDHPNVCRIYNLIETEDADYLVLERIQGQTLKQYDSQHLSKSKKIDIAVSLLSALSVAHGKNIIHRDLKPENIMIDDKDQVKVLDFGISRLSQTPHSNQSKPEQIEASDQTVAGTVMGTLTYMSPEQAAGDEITTASDIYTLGLIFQELFSSTPVYADDLTAEQLLKLSTAAETQSPVDLSNDLSQLIQRMKAKSPAQRPTAVDALVMLERIKSKPARRFKYGLIITVLALLGLGVYKHINDLNYEREQAQLAQNQAEQVTQYLTSIFTVSNPYLQKAEEISAIDLLEQGAARIDDELSDQPELQLQLKATIGDVYHVMGLLNRSKELLASAYTDMQSADRISDETRASIISKYATLVMDLGDYEMAEKLFNEAIAVLPAADPAVLENKNWLAMIHSRLNQFEKTFTLSDEIISAVNQQPTYNPNIKLNALNTAGMAHYLAGDLAAAEQSFKTANNLVNQLPQEEVEFSLITNLKGNLASVYGATGREQESLAIRKDVVSMIEEKMPPNHPDLIGAYDNLAVDYYYLEDLENAKLWNKKSLDVFAEVTANNQNQDDNFNYIYGMTLANYGVLLTRSDQFVEAEDVFQQVIEILSPVLGTSHRTVADYYYELANVNYHLSQPEKTLGYAEKALSIYALDEVPFGSRELKCWLLKASVAHDNLEHGKVNEIEAHVTAVLSQMEVQDQKLIDLAKDKFASFKSNQNQN